MALVYVIFWFCWIGTGGLTLPLAVGNGTGTPPIIPCTTVLNVGELEPESQISKGHVEYNRRITFISTIGIDGKHIQCLELKKHIEELKKVKCSNRENTSLAFCTLYSITWNENLLVIAISRWEYEFAFIFGNFHVIPSEFSFFSNWCMPKVRNRKKSRF